MEDKLKLSIAGVNVVDKVTNVKTGEVKVYDRGHNLIVNGVLPLIMSLLKGNLSGIQYWAVGSGSSIWDSTPVNPSPTETTLTKEIGRKAITGSSISFINPETNVEVDEPTTCICIKETFYEDECNGEWREFGIFGGNATSEKDSGYMIDKKHHAVLTKTEEMAVERKIYLTITFS